MSTKSVQTKSVFQIFPSGGPGAGSAMGSIGLVELGEERSFKYAQTNIPREVPADPARRWLARQQAAGRICTSLLP